MADSMNPETRSRVMSRIRGQDTRPEMYVRRAVWHAGFRYRLHIRSLPGVPDLVLARYCLTVFVNGCFWHQHGCSRSSRPSSRSEFWDRKLDDNIARDARNRAKLQELGWCVFTVWECSLEENTSELLSVLKGLQRLSKPN